MHHSNTTLYRRKLFVSLFLLVCFTREMICTFTSYLLLYIRIPVLRKRINKQTAFFDWGPSYLITEQQFSHAPEHSKYVDCALLFIHINFSNTDSSGNLMTLYLPPSN